MSKLDECQHDYIYNHVCINCGLSIESDVLIRNDVDHSKYNQRSKTIIETDLERDIKETGYDEIIINWIFNNLLRSHKPICKLESNRQKIIFAYIYLAHLNLGRSFNPWEIASQFKLCRNDTDDAIKIVSGISSNHKLNMQTSGFAASIVIIMPTSLVEGLANKLGLNINMINDIKNILDVVIQKDQTLLQRDPQKIAAGGIRYYYEINKWPFKSVSQKMGYISSITKSHCNMVKTVYENLQSIK